MDYMKRMIALFTLVLVISISGCLEEDTCKEIENEMTKHNITCKCSTTDFQPFTPEEVEERIDEVKCYCLCTKDGISVKVILLPNDVSSSLEALENP